MNKNENSDQADTLRQKVIDEYKSKTGSYPSRSEIHKKKEKKKSKYKYPAISLLALFFFLLPILFYYSISYFDNRSKTVNGENISDYEDVLIKYGDDEEESEQPDEQSLEDPEENPAEAAVGSVQSDESDALTASAQPEQKKTVPVVQDPEPKKELPEPKPEPKQQKEDYKIIEHTVGPEENLFRISIKYYSDRSGEALIKQWNQLSGDSVFEGQVLKIPIKQ